MRKAVVLFMALFVFAGLSAQASMPAYWEPAKALFPYDKKLSALQTDLLDLLDKLNCDDATECISLSKDMEITRLQIQTSLIIAFMFQEGTEQGAKFKALGDLRQNFFGTQIFLDNYARHHKKILASAKNSLLVQLGLEGVRMMESSKVEIEALYKAVKAPTSV